MAGVQFQLDGADFGAEDTVAPYAVSWNTMTATNGVHTLSAVARDAATNTTTAATVTVTRSATMRARRVLSLAHGNQRDDHGRDHHLIHQRSRGHSSRVRPHDRLRICDRVEHEVLLTSHSQTLSGLVAARLYHVRVKSRDAAGNLATSGDFTFTTLPSTSDRRTVGLRSRRTEKFDDRPRARPTGDGVREWANRGTSCRTGAFALRRRAAKRLGADLQPGTNQNRAPPTPRRSTRIR